MKKFRMLAILVLAIMLFSPVHSNAAEADVQDVSEDEQSDYLKTQYLLSDGGTVTIQIPVSENYSTEEIQAVLSDESLCDGDLSTSIQRKSSTARFTNTIASK